MSQSLFRRSWHLYERKRLVQLVHFPTRKERKGRNPGTRMAHFIWNWGTNRNFCSRAWTQTWQSWLTQTVQVAIKRWANVEIKRSCLNSKFYLSLSLVLLQWGRGCPCSESTSFAIQMKQSLSIAHTVLTIFLNPRSSQIPPWSDKYEWDLPGHFFKY